MSGATQVDIDRLIDGERVFMFRWIENPDTEESTIRTLTFPETILRELLGGKSQEWGNVEAFQHGIFKVD